MSDQPEMAGWYNEFVGKKPRGGGSSLFPELIRRCLAEVDINRATMGPPTKPVRRILDELDTGDEPDLYDPLPPKETLLPTPAINIPPTVVFSPY